MAKKEEKVNIEYMKALDNATSIKVKVDEEMKKSFIAYAMAVNVSRAIPDVRDGLKPVHRRHFVCHERHGQHLRQAHEKMRAYCRRSAGQVPSSRRQRRLRRSCQACAGFFGQMPACRRAGQLRFGRRRPRGGAEIHRSASFKNRGRAFAGI